MGCQFSTDPSGQENQFDVDESSVDNNCYNSQQRQQEVNNSLQALMILSYDPYRKDYLLTYNLREKRWYPIQLFPNHVTQSSSLNGKLYYIEDNYSGSLVFRSFNPTNKQIKTLHSSSMILRDLAICSCSRFIYFCGGGSGANSVLMYDPQKNSFATLAPMATRRRSAAAIFHQGYLYVLGGYADGCSHFLATVEKYNPATNEWTTLAPMCHERFQLAVAALDGKIYACGGSKKTVEVYDPSTNTWQLVDSMNQIRQNFMVFAHEGKLFAVGGDGDCTIEVYDPSRNLWQIDHQISSGLQLDRISNSFVI